MPRHISRQITAAAAAVALAAGAVAAEEFVFYAYISGDNEVPGNDSPALGFMAGVYDDVANTFAFNWNITDNLIGDPSAPGAHIHNAPAGANGPIVFGFASGAWDLTGSALWTDLTQEHVDALFASELYINFHTTAFPGGEVRGQIVPTPGVLALAGSGLLFAARRRRA
jgi:hypothetical protein